MTFGQASTGFSVGLLGGGEGPGTVFPIERLAVEQTLLNLLVPEDKIRITNGSGIKYAKMHESGMKLTVYFAENVVVLYMRLTKSSRGWLLSWQEQSMDLMHLNHRSQRQSYIVNIVLVLWAEQREEL